MIKLLIGLSIALTGCAQPYVNPYLDGQYSTKNIEARNAYQQDYNYCDLESLKINGSNLGETIGLQIIYRNKCMQLKGH